MIAGGNNFTTGGSAREFKSQNTKGEIAMDFLSKLLQGDFLCSGPRDRNRKTAWWTIRRGQERCGTVLCTGRALHERRDHQPANRRRSKIQRRPGQGN